MAQPAKLLHVIGLLAKEEATYGTAVSLTTTADGVQLQYTDRNTGAVMNYKYAFDGDLGPSVSALGQSPNVSPSGLSIEGPLPTRARPAGVAYSATVLPSIHRFLKASGFDATVTTTVGSEKWVYTPTPALNAFTSLTLGLYSRGELATVPGGIMNPSFDFSNPAPPTWSFDTRAIGVLPSDAAPPAITYPNITVQPPLSQGVSVVIGSFVTPVVLSGSFAMNRNIDNPRVAVSAAGAHQGFVPGDRKPTVKLVVEATALVGAPYHTSAGLDPYRLRDSANQFAFSIQFGSAQYFRWKLAMAQAQLVDAVLQGNGPTATVELTIQGNNSTPSSADDLSFTFD